MKITAQTYLLLLLTFLLGACQTSNDVAEQPEPPSVTEDSGLAISETPFGSTPAGPVTKYTLRNRNGMEVSVINRGGIITNIIVPDQAGELGDVVLGFDELDGYLGVYPYFGALVGRYGNRIAKGQFTIDGKTYQIPTNNKENTLHGGEVGFDKRYYAGETVRTDSTVGVTMRGTSPDGDQGYPGNLSVAVTYTLNNDNELMLSYRAETDAPTHVNLTNHTYFNLKGGGEILDHVLTLNASTFTPVDGGLIPTGELRPVTGTPFDFTEGKPIGRDIMAENEQLKLGLGYDHNFVLDRNGDGMAPAATLYEATTGRTVEVETTEPAIQFYSGNFLDGTDIGKGGKAYAYRTGLCLETQHYPDSPNQPDFPSTLLRPGEVYQSQTIYRFGVRE
ncbi:aldose epimerase family protein [Lewinella sp. 4G2]|uniref:aldose epimerase family protein n=1 Tax=Lewinella sp. 4G2 TaxID=1803372 RepID=UPI0007B4CEC8|nr:aldose epimerase family protein [Lewinella sp. 4G2]OAV43148.1 galactose mutarotase [Lewinella sp. 4G2]